MGTVVYLSARQRHGVASAPSTQKSLAVTASSVALAMRIESASDGVCFPLRRREIVASDALTRDPKAAFVSPDCIRCESRDAMDSVTPDASFTSTALASSVMEWAGIGRYHPCMARKKVPAGSLLKRKLSATYIWHWRKYRGLTQEALASQVAELLGSSFSAATLSRIENRKSPFGQRQLDALAEALRCSSADLIMRNPLDPIAPNSLLDSLKPATRQKAVDVLRALKLMDENANEEAA